MEIEHLGPTALECAAQTYSRKVNPHPQTILEIQDKYLQHLTLMRLGIPVAPHSIVNSRISVVDELDRSPHGLVLKTRHGAYDRRGNAEINSDSDIGAAMAKLQKGDQGIELYVEQRIPFVQEIAMMVAKGALSIGDVKTYPLVEMKHLRGQLREVRVPAQVDSVTEQKARGIVNKIAQTFFRGAGVFGVEMFLGQDNQIWVNETAPRVHNTGHYTIEACATSQFLNHMFAVTEQALQSTDLLYPYAGMVNIIGDYTGVSEVVKLGNAFIHDYQKSPRPERKLAHVTLVGNDYEDFNQRMQKASALLTL